MSPIAPALPAGSTLGHSYEWGLDVDLAGLGLDPSWQIVRRISDFQPAPTPITQDAQTYDDFGSANADKTGENYTISFTLLVNRSQTSGLYLPEAEAINARTEPDAKGDAAVLRFRYYHKPETGTPHPNQAYEGEATVAISRANIAATGEVERWNVTLTGKGPRRRIANPFAGWGEAVVPVVQRATPTGAGEGDIVTITGTGFLEATQVQFGASNAGDFEVLGDATLVAVLPAGADGSAAIKVTTPDGESNALPYTRTA